MTSCPEDINDCPKTDQHERRAFGRLGYFHRGISIDVIAILAGIVIAATGWLWKLGDRTTVSEVKIEELQKTDAIQSQKALVDRAELKQDIKEIKEMMLQMLQDKRRQ